MGFLSKVGDIISNAPTLALAAVPGLGGFLGQESANTANAQQASQQMDFQREMSNTAHQREVADLRKAGLNPMISGMGGSGASSPSGASARMENSMAGMSELASSAMQLASLKKDLELKDDQIKLTRANEKKASHEGAIAEVEERNADMIQRAREGDPTLLGDNKGHTNVPRYYKDLIKAQEKQNRASAKQSDYDSKVIEMDSDLVIPDAILKRLPSVLAPANSARKILTPRGN
nr:MAG: DNA pilot protein [Microvirus sp.]